MGGYPADRRDRQLLGAVKQSNCPGVRIALCRGAQVNARGGKRGFTPLLRAASLGHLDVARLLLDHGAAVDLADLSGGTPLMHAATAGHPAMVELLLAAGAGVNTRDPHGQSALGRVEQLLTASRREEYHQRMLGEIDRRETREHGRIIRAAAKLTAVVRALLEAGAAR